jgi:hypothetical protein
VQSKAQQPSTQLSNAWIAEMILFTALARKLDAKNASAQKALQKYVNGLLKTPTFMPSTSSKPRTTMFLAGTEPRLLSEMDLPVVTVERKATCAFITLTETAQLPRESLETTLWII